MAIGNNDEFVDMVAQAVIDRIEERSRVSSLVEQVVARVIEIQTKEAQARAEAEAGANGAVSPSLESESEKLEKSNG